jgi:dihydrofolate synthase/folylpolyglutamate synthase
MRTSQKHNPDHYTLEYPVGAHAAQLEWLFSRQCFGMRPGLERIRALLAELGEPQLSFESVLVGGTNGKGSTAATLTASLEAAGRRVALFTSPHLTHFSERFVVDGGRLPGASIRAALETLKPAAEALDATFFEVVTALACLLFKEAGTDIAVMEVGLGGRFDATNALEPLLSIITGISLDHTEVLGDTLEQIAFEKAGIMRPGKLCLTGAEGEALITLRREAECSGTVLWAIGGEIELESKTLGWQGITCTVHSPCGTLRARSPLLGRHQARNVALAAVAAQHLGASAEAVRQGTARTRWPGRLEPTRYRGRTFLLDGAHNPAAAKVLAGALADLSVKGGEKELPLIFGISKDKDAAGVIAALREVVGEVILTKAKLSPRARDPLELQAFWSQSTFVTQKPEEALELAIARTQPGQHILVAGSLYLIGEMRPLLLGEVAEGLERWQ